MEIGAWGDSITYGAGDTEALGWVGRLRRELYESESGIYNRGICGDSTTDVLKRFEIELESIEPTVIILAVGINDSKFPEGGAENKVPIGIFKDNIKQLASKAKSKSKKVILIGLTEVNEQEIESSSVFQNDIIRKYDDCLQELAHDENIDFISMRGVLDTQADLEDGLHPNATGYEKMFRTILPFIK